MRGRQLNPAFAQSQVKSNQNGVSITNKIKKARQDGTLNFSSQMPPLTGIHPAVFDDTLKVDEDEKFWAIEPLRLLDVSFNQLTTLPEEVGNLADCATLKARDNNISSLPESLFSGCISLKHLDLGKNRLKSLSGGIAQLAGLRELFLQSNGLAALPEELGQCVGLKVLDVSDNALTTLHPELFRRLSAFSSLNVSKNKLQQLPASMAELGSLETLVCSYNALAVLPSLDRCKSLKLLDATANSLQRFPVLPAMAEGLSKNALQFLHLGYNQVCFE